MFCVLLYVTLLYVHYSIAIILMGKRELVALLDLSSWCLVMVERLFVAMPRGCLRFVIVVFPDHTHYFLYKNNFSEHGHVAYQIKGKEAYNYVLANVLPFHTPLTPGGS